MKTIRVYLENGKYKDFFNQSDKDINRFCESVIKGTKYEILSQESFVDIDEIEAKNAKREAEETDKREAEYIRIVLLIANYLNDDDVISAVNCLTTSFLYRDPSFIHDPRMDFIKTLIQLKISFGLKYGDKSTWCSDPDQEKIRRAIIDKEK